jgi:uncharacterized protein YjbI with pentapeptide repeats
MIYIHDRYNAASNWHRIVTFFFKNCCEGLEDFIAGFSQRQPHGDFQRQGAFLFGGKRMTEEKLKAILDDHQLWTEGKGGFRANLNGAMLDSASLRGASLRGASLDGASLDGASLDDANLDSAMLDGANLNGANLRGAKLNGAILDSASLDGAILDGASLRGASLRGASLDGANLNGANLNDASLDDASLDGANLIGAMLDGASLNSANLNGANLNDANLNDAILEGASLDFSSLPLSCGGLRWKIDRRIAAQLAYHFCSMECSDPYFIKARNEILDFANQFHRVNECGRLVPIEKDGRYESKKGGE